LDEVGCCFAELGAQAADVHIDGAGAAVVLVAPHPAQQDLAGEHLARVLGEELQQLVLHVGEIQRVAVDRGLVGLQVQCQPAVLHHLRPRFVAAAEEHVAQARLELRGVERAEAEVVEQFVAQLQVGELAAVDQHDERAHRSVALAQRAAQRPGAVGVGVAGDDGAGPAGVGFVARRILRRADCLPAIAGKVERAREIGRRWLGEDRHQFHLPGPVHRPSRVHHSARR
jgi:hypothetical protein